MPRGVPHAETPQDLKTPYGIIVCMQARNGMYLHRARADAERKIMGYGSMLVHGTRMRAAGGYLDEIARHETVPKNQRARYVSALVETFLLTLLSELQQPAPPDPAGSALVIETEKMVHTLLADSGLTIARLAAGLGCSTDHLSRRFHKERGITLNAWIARERIRYARELLADPRYNVSEVAWACGFTTASYFIRIFRGQTGVTPRVFRLAGARG